MPELVPNRMSASVRWVWLLAAWALVPVLSGCATLPEERKVTIQEIGQRGLSIAVFTRLWVRSDRIDSASGKGIQDLLIGESLNAGRVLKHNAKQAFERQGIPVRKSLFVRSGQSGKYFLESTLCRQFFDIDHYDEKSPQRPSKALCTRPGDDAKLISNALPYLSPDWDEPLGDTMPPVAVNELRAKINSRYLLVLYYSGHVKTERVRKSHAALRALTVLHPAGLADAIIRSANGNVDETRLYSIVVYDTHGSQLRRVFHTQTISDEEFVGIDPRAWTEDQIKKYLVDDLLEDKVFRRR